MIDTNKKDATDTVARIFEDREADALGEPQLEPSEAWVLERASGAIT